MPNPWDVGTALVLAGLGYKALATTSGGLAFVLGRRDGEGAVSREQALAHSAVIAGATDLPVNGDLENGFGRRPGERRRDGPRRGRGRSRRLLDRGFDLRRGRADLPALPGRGAHRRRRRGREALPFPFTLTARAENYLHGRSDLDDTIERLQAFEKAGAHVLYAPGLLDIDDIRTVCTSVSRPVNVLALAGSPSVELLSAAGVRRISLGTGLIRTAQGAFLRAAREVHEHGTFGVLDGSATSREINPFMRDA